MTETDALTPEKIDAWASDGQGSVALHLKQKLQPVEVDGRVIYPPTYADIGYNIDTLSDGTKVALIDSVGSQANRMEPIFKELPYSELVPQIDIEIPRSGKKGEDRANGEKTHVEKLSLLDLAHRGADAVVHATPTLKKIIAPAFQALKERNDAGPLCRVAPTSLIFGVWDSRGDSQQKRPRLVRAIIRAWDIEPLHAAAQFNSVWKMLDDDQKADLDKEAKARKIKLSAKGFKDAPGVFRQNVKVPERLHGVRNPEARVLGGVAVNGAIERDVTINLVALRSLKGESAEDTASIRQYLLALTLIAATADIELFLREGCNLRFAGEDTWNDVLRRGDPMPVDLASAAARETLFEYAKKAAEPFRVAFRASNHSLSHKFDVKEAKKLLAKKTDEDGD